MNASLKQTIYYAAGLVISKGMALIMLPYVTQVLSVEEYGVLEILLVIANFSCVILGFGLVGAMFRFIGNTNSESEKQKILNVVFTLVLIISGVSFILLQLVVDWGLGSMPASVTQTQLRLIIITLVLDGLIAIPLSYLRIKDRARTYFLLTLSKEIAQLLMIFFLLENGFGVTGVIAAGAITSIIFVILLLLISLPEFKLKFDYFLLRKLIIYGFPLVISGIAGFIILGLDRWLLANSLGVEVLAHYAIAIKFTLIVSMMVQPYGLWWYPRRFSVLRTESGLTQTARYSSIGVCLGLIAACFIGLVSPIIIDLLLPKEYDVAKQYIPFLVICMAIKNASEFMNIGCFSEETSNTQMWINLVCCLIAILGYVLLIEYYEVFGVIITLLFCYLVRFVLFYWASQRVIFIPYPNKGLVDIFLLVCYILYANQYFQATAYNLCYVIFSMSVLMLLCFRLKLLPQVTKLVFFGKTVQAV